MLVEPTLDSGLVTTLELLDPRPNVRNGRSDRSIVRLQEQQLRPARGTLHRMCQPKVRQFTVLVCAALNGGQALRTEGPWCGMGNGRTRRRRRGDGRRFVRPAPFMLFRDTPARFDGSGRAISRPGVLNVALRRTSEPPI